MRRRRIIGPSLPYLVSTISVGAAWTPIQLSGLVAWYKADAGVTVDGSNNIQSVADQSGKGYTLTATSVTGCMLNSTGINGHAAFEFIPANSSWLKSVTDVVDINSNLYTFYAVVVMRTATGTNGRPVSFAEHAASDIGPGGIAAIQRNGSNNELSFYHQNTFGIASTTLGTAYRRGIVSDGTTGFGYQDGAQVGATDPSSSSALSGSGGGTLVLGNRINADAVFDGFIGELVVTKTNNTVDITLGGNLDSYFKTRFGL